MPIRIHNQDKYQLITIDREQTRGALDRAYLDQLMEAFAKISAPLVCLTGSGASFCAGLDLKHLASLDSNGKKALNAHYGQMLQMFDRLPAVKVAFVNGPAVGGGCGFVFSADWVIAHPQVFFRCPELDIGLLPSQIFPYMMRDMSQNHARRWLLGDKISAAKALDQGVVQQLSEEKASEWLEKNAQKAITISQFMAQMAVLKTGDPVLLSEIFLSDEKL